MEFLSALTIGITRFAIMIAAIALALVFLKELGESKPNAPPASAFNYCRCKAGNTGHVGGTIPPR